MRRRWTALVRKFQSSGQTQAAFCERHGISVSNLQYHLKKTRSSEGREIVPAGFVEVIEADRASGVELQIVFPNGTSVRLRG